MKSERIIKVFAMHPEGNMNVSNKYQVNSSNGGPDISLKMKSIKLRSPGLIGFIHKCLSNQLTDRQTNRNIHRDIPLTWLKTAMLKQFFAWYARK